MMRKAVVILTVLAFCFLAAVHESPAADAGKVKLPGMMTWSAFDVGSRGYVQGAAISNALTKVYGTKVRILPSGTSVGRLMPMKTGAATYGLLADETFFAAEAIYDFATPDWGPQDLRVLLAHPGPISLVATAKSGIKTPKDVNGKRVGWIPGGSTNNVKTEAFLAFAGLTWKDVQRVDMPSYAAAGKGLTEGKIDAICYGITAPLMYELEASPQGISWPEFPASDVEGWKRIQAITPWVRPGKCDMGPGFKKGEFKEIPSYTYPQLVCYAKQDANETYSLVRAFDETFDMYKGADPEMPEWAITRAGKHPAGAPFHEGAIRYLKEKGIWTAEADQWNAKFIERLKRVKQAWTPALEEAKAKKVAEKDFAEFWMNKRKEIKD
ncbi:MAG TPA: TAXI family TRAP transporter solute-binding subunit [Thermodesulfobacteriota bacterium]|nr:TAXI family TRAP transporter solute-binding subunit [Thermodesulfobacteriota bacterium]